MTNNNMIFIANWKMHGNLKDISKVNLVSEFINQKKFKKNKIIYCPPYTLLNTFNHKFKNTKILIGAQNCHDHADYGPFTGSINTKLIKNCGAKFVILGHSENRIEGETDNLINKKITSALNDNLNVIFCVGESLSEKRKKITSNVLRRQISIGLNKIKSLKSIIIAYEPVWSIGTGNIPEKYEIEKNIQTIKKTISRFKKKSNVKILYGGSVNPNNASEISKIKVLDGFLIGGASLNPKKFIDIIKKSSN